MSPTDGELAIRYPEWIELVTSRDGPLQRYRARLTPQRIFVLVSAEELRLRVARKRKPWPVLAGEMEVAYDTGPHENVIRCAKALRHTAPYGWPQILASSPRASPAILARLQEVEAAAVADRWHAMWGVVRRQGVAGRAKAIREAEAAVLAAARAWAWGAGCSELAGEAAVVLQRLDASNWEEHADQAALKGLLESIPFGVVHS